MADETENVIRVGSRKSELAMIQTRKIISALKEIYSEKEFQIETMETIGDKIQDKALSKIGEKSLFTKELEQALAVKQVDMIVHSLKDLPTTLPDGMVIAAVYKRDDPHDAVVFHPSVIGTSSVRRVAQLKKSYPHLAFKDVRGNLNTRLRKLDDANDYSALVLAKAGLERMGWNSRINQVLGPNECMYSVSQGAMAVEIRADDDKMIECLSKLQHMDTLLECVAERALLRKLEGGCSAPVGVYTDIKEGELHLTAAALSLDGSECVKMSMSTRVDFSSSSEIRESDNRQAYSSIVAPGKCSEALKAVEDLGTDLAIKILENGGREILEAAHEENKQNVQQKPL
ncbi:porphobilinogen deaminase-like isoform X2 [Antedon mediterranea]|uniref:porphobilinogen deaminase-like isoform X2 n=1 Tax=Antedon mediterranea TaxID=105859 RepID=UPI003AF7E1B7